MTHSHSYAIVCVTLGLLLAACSGVAGPDPSSLPLDTAGPWTPAYRTWEIHYSSPTQEGERTVDLHVWYPTEEALDTSRVPVYTIPAGRDPESLRDGFPATPALATGYPVVAYSHGHRGLPEGSHALMRRFASQGWLAVSVGHVGNRLVDGAAAEATPLAHWAERPLDVSAALDALEGLPPGDPLAGLADTSRVMLTGHSRGSYTPWAMAGARFDVETLRSMCEAGEFSEPCTEAEIALFEVGFRDPRIVAGLPTAGDGHRYLFGELAAGMADAEIPLLMMSADADRETPDLLFADIQGTTDVVWVELQEGCHELFNLGCGNEQDALGFPVFATYAMAFARVHVLHDTAPEVVRIVNGTALVSSRATYLR